MKNRSYLEKYSLFQEQFCLKGQKSKIGDRSYLCFEITKDQLAVYDFRHPGLGVYWLGASFLIVPSLPEKVKHLFLCCKDTALLDIDSLNPGILQFFNRRTANEDSWRVENGYEQMREIRNGLRQVTAIYLSTPEGRPLQLAENFGFEKCKLGLMLMRTKNF